MTIHVDRTHHHPLVYKNRAYWCARCPRCGLLRIDGRLWFSRHWRIALVAALTHATKELT